LMEQGISNRAFPGAVVLIARHGVIVKDSAYGYAELYTDDKFHRSLHPLPMRRDTLFDLASLSKLFTTTAVMKLWEEGRLRLDNPVASYIPAFAVNGKAKVTVRMLLTHTSGLPSSLPLWKESGAREKRLASVYSLPLQHSPGAVYEYSDLNFIVLGALVETVSGQRLDVFIQRNITGPLGLADTMYDPPPQLKQRIAATEYQTSAHRGLVWGQVHDENAYALGGVAGHAGVFSTASDLAVFAQMILGGGTYDGHQILKPQTVQAMEANQVMPQAREHALGWELDQPWYMGALASPETMGHTGFTGTSLVIDPSLDLIVILLTNRVHPTRTGPSLNPYRQQLADLIAQSIDGS